ncbi:hypothetical protein [Spongiivirga citrea]|uniref:Uncharacterized protein n=1 Tax=Spongiivirga citrea TaxID=1481457 RepID=A0A6M0CJJ1_9FLAO|nr:hypothetical protein [Spongiivirga citrea]NER18096.1 hypothetical protein [Spongiivirga citrea]
MLRKKRLFKKERTFLGIQPAYKDNKKLIPNLIVDVAAIRNERLKVKRSDRQKMTLTVLAITLTCASAVFLIHFMASLTVKPLQLNTPVDQNKLIVQDTYIQFLTTGINFRQSKDYHLASLEFKKALLMNNQLVDAHLELLKMYLEQCSTKGINCDLVKEKREFVIQEYPDIGFIDYH